MEISYATPNLGRVFLVCLYSCVSCRCSALPGAPENEDQDDEEHEDEDNADQEHEDLDDEAAMALEELEIEAAHEEAQDVCFCFSSPLRRRTQLLTCCYCCCFCCCVCCCCCFVDSIVNL